MHRDAPRRTAQWIRWCRRPYSAEPAKHQALLRSVVGDVKTCPAAAQHVPSRRRGGPAPLPSTRRGLCNAIAHLRAGSAVPLIAAATRARIIAGSGKKSCGRRYLRRGLTRSITHDQTDPSCRRRRPTTDGAERNAAPALAGTSHGIGGSTVRRKMALVRAGHGNALCQAVQRIAVPQEVQCCRLPC